MSTSNSAYFKLQARCTELAQEAEFANLMFEAISKAASDARYDVAHELELQALSWDEKARDARTNCDNLKEATKRCYGFTLHG